MHCANHVCECGEGRYLSFFGDKATCLTAEDTIGTYRLHGRPVYADERYCRKRLDMYPIDDGGSKLCVNRSACIEKDWFVLYDWK